MTIYEEARLQAQWHADNGHGAVDLILAALDAAERADPESRLRAFAEAHDGHLELRYWPQAHSWGLRWLGKDQRWRSEPGPTLASCLDAAEAAKKETKS